MKDRYTDTLKEKIYTATKEDGRKKFEQVSSFLEEVAKRKRFDHVEGGLQAAVVILPDKFAAKVNEEDGYGPHLDSKINLVKVLNDESTFISRNGSGFPALYKPEFDQIILESVEISVLGGEEEFKTTIGIEENIISSR